jgi:hypothetical protein
MTSQVEHTHLSTGKDLLTTIITKGRPSASKCLADKTEKTMPMLMGMMNQFGSRFIVTLRFNSTDNFRPGDEVLRFRTLIVHTLGCLFRLPSEPVTVTDFGFHGNHMTSAVVASK